MARLADLGLETSALCDPLTYPGRQPPTSGLLVDDCFLPVRPQAGERLGGQPTLVDPPIPALAEQSGATLTVDTVLGMLNAAPVDDRYAVLAIGSNASPGQVLAKLRGARVATALPMIRASVDGLRPAVAAHVSRPGYVPITAVPDDTARGAPLVVLLCDPAQVAALDRTEPNYWRVDQDASSQVTLDGGEVLAHVCLYVGRHGALLDEDGAVSTWTTATAAIESVLSCLPEARSRCGASPAAFVESCQADEPLRRWIRDELRERGCSTPHDAPSAASLQPYGAAQTRRL